MGLLLPQTNAERSCQNTSIASKNSTGGIALGSVVNVENDALAKAHAKIAFATFLDFDSLEIWLLDRHIETLRRAPKILVFWHDRSALV